MNFVGPLPLPAAMSSIPRPEATEVDFLVDQRAAVRLDRPAVVVLDQEPVVALLALAALHAHQHPRALQPLAVQGELQVALAPAWRSRVALGLPVAAIPQHHRAAAVLALGDRPFEVAVVQRVVLDLHGEALVGGVQRRARVTAQDRNTPSSSRRKS